jgi:hypothetical protein
MCSGRILYVKLVILDEDWFGQSELLYLVVLGLLNVGW